MLFGKSPEEKLYKMICNHYDKKGISYRRDNKQHTIQVVNKDCEIPVNIFVSAATNPSALQICHRMTFEAPEESRDMMVMALQAVNQRLPLGHFRISMSDGTIDYRVNLPLVGIQYGEEWLENVLNEASYTFTGREERLLSLLHKEITFEEFDKYVR